MQKRGALKKHYFILLFLFVMASQKVMAQDIQVPVVQVSGVVIGEGLLKEEPLPFVFVLVQGTNRGTYTNPEGFYSLVTRRGDILEYHAVGFKSAYRSVPQLLGRDSYTMNCFMEKDSILLPELIVRPWPSRERFALEFLALNPENSLEKIAADNLSSDKVKEMMKNLPPDGAEGAHAYQRQYVAQTYWAGQVRPMPIFSPLAWIQFFKYLKEGKFKKDPQKGKN